MGLSVVSTFLKGCNMRVQVKLAMPMMPNFLRGEDTSEVIFHVGDFEKEDTEDFLREYAKAFREHVKKCKINLQLLGKV